MPYARYLKPYDDKDFSVLRIGGVYILGECEREDYECTLRVPIFRDDGSSDYTTSYWLNETETHFELLDEEEGEREYDAFTRVLRDELRAINGTIEHSIQSGEVSRLMAGSDPTLLISGAIDTDVPEEPEPVMEGETMALAPLPSAQKQAGSIRNHLHSLSRKMSELGNRANGIRAEIDARMKDKIALYKEQATGLGRYLRKLQGGIDTVNLYLGRAEEITVIRTGAKAGADVPLRIRQQVLRMDEEMAVLYSEGIDYKALKDFDEWIQQAENLHAILPDEKGIVVLVPTLRERYYDPNPLVNALVNKENLKSYWLLRNGENLYRIHSDIEVRGTLFPRSDEVPDLFKPDHGRRPPRPGSEEYYRAMEKEEGKVLHSLQVALLLQGLLDRTLIFAPFPDGIRPNLLDPGTFGGEVELVRDAEGWLGDGRPTFSKWVIENNAKLIPGDRIVGTFRRDWRDDRDPRITPSGAEGFDAEEIRTLVRKNDHSFKFLFTRTDKVWNGSYSAVPSQRGSYTIYPTDEFFLNIDAITVEEIDYYIGNRLSRSSYFEMMATLQRAKRIKLEEAKQEEPFIKLLDLHLRTIEDKRLPVTDELLAEIIHWWKVKAKDRRPLLAAEQSAFRMIVGQYRTLVKERVSVPPEKLARIADAFAAEADVVRVTRELNGSLVVTRRANDNGYFVHTDLHKISRDGTLEPPKATGRWTFVPLVAKRAGQILFERPDFHSYLSKGDISRVPGDLIDDAIAALRDYRYGGRNDETWTYLGTFQKGDRLTGLYFKRYVPYEGEAPRISIEAREISINKDREPEAGWCSRGYGDFDLKGNRGVVSLPLDCSGVEVSGFSLKLTHTYPTVDLNPEGIQSMEPEVTAYFVGLRREERIRKAVRERLQVIDFTVRSEWRRREEVRYLEQGGDMEFFDDHLKTVPAFSKAGGKSHQWMAAVLDGLARKGGSESLRDPSSLRELFRAGDNLKAEHDTSDRWASKDNRFPSLLTSLRSNYSDFLDVKFIQPTKNETL